jgi:hypothetical protein
MCSVAETETDDWPSAVSRWRMPSSCAGMTRVSLNTSASPGLSQSGRSRTLPSLITGSRAGSTTSSRALSRGAGRTQRDPLFRQIEIEKIDTHD